MQFSHKHACNKQKLRKITILSPIVMSFTANKIGQFLQVSIFYLIFGTYY